MGMKIKGILLYAGTFLLAIAIGASAQIGYQIRASSATITTLTVTDITVSNDLTVTDGQGLFDDGSESLPGVAFSSDPDNGMYFRGGNELAFSTAGNEAFRISASGQTRFRNGSSASSPSVSSVNDTDTGISWGASGQPANHLAFVAGGKDLGIWTVTTGTLTATQVRKLNATPIEVIAAPGVGIAICIESVQFMLDFGTVAFDSVGAGEDLQLQINSVVQFQCDETTCLNGDASADVFGKSDVSQGTTGGRVLAENTAAFINISTAEWAAADLDANGDSLVHYLIRHRVVTLDLS